MARPALLLLLVACGPVASPPRWTPPPSTGPFTDVTRAYGLDAPQAARPGYVGDLCAQAAFMTAGGAAGDVDGDGWPDLFLSRLGLPDRLLINLEGRGFEDRAGAAGVAFDGDSGGALLFDPDRDGDLDLYVSSPTGPSRLYANDGRGRFVEVPGAGGARLPAAGDCTKGFGASTADVNGDGHLDLVTAARDDSDRSRLFLGDGALGFIDATPAYGIDLADRAHLVPVLFDLDGDADLDLLAVGDFDDTRVYRNQAPAPRFVDASGESVLATIHDGMGADLGDVDGDGHPDLFVSGICLPRASGCLDASGWTGNRLFLGDGAGGWRDAAGPAGVADAGWAWGAAFFDPDLDGDLDLAVTNGFGALLAFEDPVLRVFENDGVGRFEPVAEAWGLDVRGQSRAVIPFDFDLDGDEDLLVLRHAAPPALLRNDLEPRGAVVVVPAPVGSTVRLWREGGRTVRREVTGNTRFLAHPPREARFGGLPHAGPWRFEIDAPGAPPTRGWRVAEPVNSS